VDACASDFSTEPCSSTGPSSVGADSDAVDATFINHAVWYWTTDWKRPYPGDSEIKWPDEFVKAAAQKVRDDDDDDDRPLQ